MNAFQIKERMVIERKNEIKLSWFGSKKALFDKVEGFSQTLIDKISTVRRLTSEYQRSKKSRDKSLYLKIKTLRKSLKSDLKSWKKLSKKILRFDACDEVPDEIELSLKEMALLEQF